MTYWAAKGPMLLVCPKFHNCFVLYLFSLISSFMIYFIYTRESKQLLLKALRGYIVAILLGCVIPLCFKPSEDAESLGLTGHERFTIDLPRNIKDMQPGQDVNVVTDTGKSFTCTARFDTEVKLAYFDHGGILQYVLQITSQSQIVTVNPLMVHP